MRRNTLLALFIWAMVAAIFAVAMPAAARRDGIHPQGRLPLPPTARSRSGTDVVLGKFLCYDRPGLSIRQLVLGALAADIFIIPMPTMAAVTGQAHAAGSGCPLELSRDDAVHVLIDTGHHPLSSVLDRTVRIL
nr:unnamed protein product [Digitaria exilis]